MVKTKEIVSQVENRELVKKKHDQIIHAASNLFARKGYHSTTMRDIAEASGINLSYLYNYISSKDDILYLYYQSLYRHWEHVYRSLGEPTEEDPVRQLKNFILAMLEIALKMKREIWTMITESRHLQPDSLHAVLSAESEMVKCIEAVIKRGVERGVFRTEDSFVAANTIQYLIMIECLRGWNFSKRTTFGYLSRQITSFILRALCCRDDDFGCPDQNQRDFI